MDLELFIKGFFKISKLLSKYFFKAIFTKSKKVIDIEQTEIKGFFEEVVAMLMCESNNLVKIYGVTVSEELIGSMLRIFIVMELLKWDLK